MAPRPRVLYVESAVASARYLQGALTQSGFDVTCGRRPAFLSRRRISTRGTSLIVSDVARSAISDAAMKALAVWVERDGGGLLVAGGDAVFGEASEGGPGGYRNTELERITPVTFERKDEPEDRADHRARQVLEHGGRRDGALQSGGAGRD